MTENNQWKSIWTTRTKYVDIDTGEIIEKNDLEKYNYIIIKTKKYAKRSKYGTGGIKYYTNECRKSKFIQQNLFNRKYRST